MGSITPHIAILPSSGMGHVTPLLVFAKRLVTLHDFHVTLFVLSTTESAAPAQSRLISAQSSLPDRLRVIELPPTNVSLPPDALLETRISVIFRESVPSLRKALAELSPKRTVLVVDIFGTDAFDLADELGMSKYIYFTSTAYLLAITMYLPTLDKEVEGEYVDLKEPVQLPGCRPMQIEDLINPMLDRKNDRYKWYLHQARGYPLAHGILVNTCEALEPAEVAALQGNEGFLKVPTPPIYPVGPLVRSPEQEDLSWLESQPENSVLFVSFGSGGTLSAEQMVELAFGLENSGMRFLWVVRPPPTVGKDSASSYFTSGEDMDDPSKYLPDGFLERTTERGIVVPSWVPQVQVLAHPSVAAFLTHGGWNSVSESIVHGVPMIMWPLYAEQKTNAVKLSAGVLGVAERVRKGGVEGVVVGREEVERAVRVVMEGEEGKEMKKRVEELREAVVRVLEEGGSSYNSLAEVAELWKKRSSCEPASN